MGWRYLSHPNAVCVGSGDSVAFDVALLGSERIESDADRLDSLPMLNEKGLDAHPLAVEAGLDPEPVRRQPAPAIAERCAALFADSGGGSCAVEG